MPDFQPGDRLRVVDAENPNKVKVWPLKKAADLTAARVTSQGKFVGVREFPGLFRASRFAKA